MSKAKSGSPRDKAMVEAIEKAGGATKVADELGITQSAVSQWERVPANRLFLFAEVTGVDPKRLRPDMFPKRQSARVAG